MRRRRAPGRTDRWPYAISAERVAWSSDRAAPAGCRASFILVGVPPGIQRCRPLRGHACRDEAFTQEGIRHGALIVVAAGPRPSQRTAPSLERRSVCVRAANEVWRLPWPSKAAMPERGPPSVPPTPSQPPLRLRSPHQAVRSGAPASDLLSVTLEFGLVSGRVPLRRDAEPVARTSLSRESRCEPFCFELG